MSRTKGSIRMMLDQMQAMSKASGLTIEQVADFYDACALVQRPSSTDDRLAGLTVEGPKRTQ